jgi:hypothetical protein
MTATYCDSHKVAACLNIALIDCSFLDFTDGLFTDLPFPSQ